MLEECGISALQIALPLENIWIAIERAAWAVTRGRAPEVAVAPDAGSSLNTGSLMRATFAIRTTVMRKRQRFTSIPADSVPLSP